MRYPALASPSSGSESLPHLADDNVHRGGEGTRLDARRRRQSHFDAFTLAGIAAGADGLMIEAHPNPDHALSDGAQSLWLEEFAALTPKMRAVAEAVGRTLSASAVVV